MNNYYVYRYIHPEYPWLYVGKTKSLENRIKTHDFGKTDNIERKYENLLLESSVYYLELENSTQMSIVELYLIDKYSPHLNKKDKHMSKSKMKLTIPRWKKYVRSYEIKEPEQRNRSKLDKLKKELEISNYEVIDAEKNLAINAERLSKIRNNNDLINKYVEFFYDKSRQQKQANYEIDLDDIKELFEKFPDCSCSFRIDVFNCLGNSASQIIDKDGLWEVIDFDYKNKKLVASLKSYDGISWSPMFSVLSGRLITDVNKYTCSCITPLILLKQINEEKIEEAELEKKECISNGEFALAEKFDEIIREYSKKIERYGKLMETYSESNK